MPRSACLVTSGPGGIRLLNCLRGAKLDLLPVRPGKVQSCQAKKFAEVFLRGQPRRAAIATTLFKNKIDRFES